ncbi:TolB-like translocation protein [Adhaeretor mobilis]|uniref:Translocation protein TolB n=1 Tax=Adhaeretor mobilis TaxID=1930276 RepID=A0A517MQS4_9BACT|nr:hypothetical protein [Adhaeretor mobilis]QDS97233.1 translocation protein TolB [Adhaeretor mobilis]
MRQSVTRLLLACCSVATLAGDVHAVRIMTNPATSPTDQFDNIALTPDGNTIVATATFFPEDKDRVYSLPVPANPAVDMPLVTQLSTSGGAFTYDVAFAPVISPDGQTILFAHDGNSTASNTIYTMPITGEGSSAFTGLLGAAPNLASPGDGSSHPIYSGTDVFFLNNNAGFGGSIPTFPASPVPYDGSPDWDMIYKRNSAGTVTAVTAPGDGDIDGGLFAVTPNGSSIVYAPDNPVRVGTDKSGIRPKLFTISTSGGTSTEIPLTATAHDFTIANQLQVTPNGQNVLFIGDYETIGKNELFSVPLAGGTPTRISDDLYWAGDVSSFAIAPSGTHVAYAAGQNNGANHELFQTPITGGTGNSVRVSEPAPINSGIFDVSPSAEGGQMVYSNDSSQIYYLGDLTTAEVNDLYVVDTTAKAGLVPSPFTFVGPSGGDFFTESNWEDAQGNNPPANTINPGSPIRHALLIDGDTVGVIGNGREADFQVGGSLELTAGSFLDFTNLGTELDFNNGSGLKLTDATIKVHQDIFLEGTNVLSGGTIESTDDDIEFQDFHKTSINGTTFITGANSCLADNCNLIFENSATSITGATFEAADSIGLRYEVDLTVHDTALSTRGMGGDLDNHPGGPGWGNVEDVFTNGPQAAGSTLTLNGSSTLLANSIHEGVSLVLDGTSVATLLADPGGHPGDPIGGFDLVDSNFDGTITFMSAGAELITLNASASDARAKVINGLTGLSYLDDPTAWNVTNWDGLSVLASLKLVGSSLAGDFDNDNDVDGADFLLAQQEADPAAAVAAWSANYGASLSTPNATGVPEPASLALLLTAFGVCGPGRRTRQI